MFWRPNKLANMFAVYLHPKKMANVKKAKINLNSRDSGIRKVRQYGEHRSWRTGHMIRVDADKLLLDVMLSAHRSLSDLINDNHQ